MAAFAPAGANAMGAVVRLPFGVAAPDLGLRSLTPGLGRLRGAPGAIIAFAAEHPDLRIEVAPPLHLLLDTASVFVAATAAIGEGLDGSGAVVGIADTGLDVTHPDFLDAQGHTRVAWLIDLSVAPLGKHPDLEQTYGTTDASGNLAFGAVWSADDINAALDAKQLSTLPQDDEGHGTLVASCAAGNGSSGQSPYRGVAPGATLVIARVAAAGTDSIDVDDILRGVGFLYDRGDALGLPTVVNLSIGSDFGPHDGTLAWEQSLASYVGPAHPGHALVAAAGNSGSIAAKDFPVHESVHVSSGATTRVPILTSGAQNGGVEVWVAMHSGSHLRVGLDAPDGTWISPVAPGQSAGKNTNDYNAGIFNGSQAVGSPVPAQSSGAVVEWDGAWVPGTYFVTLEGTGTADLYLAGIGDAAIDGFSSVRFVYGVRESTVNLPATHPSIIGVGCTINKGSWRSIDMSTFGLSVPIFDEVGGKPEGGLRDAAGGEPCWFSSAGPTLTGFQKPEIMAPGAAIVGALSQQAVPPSASSIFTASCPPSEDGGVDPSCEQIDAFHAVSAGTSFSAPMVAGAVAVLLQRDPTLTQDQVLAALQGGAHHVRGPAPFDDQAGTGEVDVLGAVAALDQGRNPEPSLPVRERSWLTLGADAYLADGSTPLQVILSLRADPGDAGGVRPADDFGDGRLAAYALVDGLSQAGAVQSFVRRGPGVWVATIHLPPGLGGENLTVGATFDGADVADPKTVPIATDVWNAEYPPSVKGGCSVARAHGAEGAKRAGDGGPVRAAFASLVALVVLVSIRRRGNPRGLTRAAQSKESSLPVRSTSRPIGPARA
jgi:subtilisin family serine protease